MTEQATYQPESRVAIFFRSFFLLILFVVIGGGIGWGIATNQPPQWKVTAKFEPPKVVNLGNYYDLASTYLLLQGGSTGLESTDKVIEEQSYNEFKRSLNSPDILQQFLLQNDQVNKLAKNYKVSIETMSQQLFGQFQFKDKENVLSFSFDNAELSYQILNDYIQFVTDQTRSILNGELVAKWRVLFQQVKLAAETNLGAIQQGNQVVQQDWAGKLTLMRSAQPLDDKLVPYHFVQSPVMPLSPYSPDKLLWTMLGALGGLLLGFFVISISSFFANANES
ncbi:transporter [Otariodibacter sp.]|uniref:transporter n=1 Tax=Otariodibacter sp. TaxID=3030919 RepID=UPI00261FDDE0|nr:transporter [Otariodibacter sp.]